MEFGNPTAFYFMAIAAVAAIILIYEIAWSDSTVRRLVSHEVFKKTVAGYSRRRKIAKRAMLVAVMALIVLAWAMPRMGRGMRIVKREGSDVVIALDISASMLAEDVEPNRIEVAKRGMSSLVAQLAEHRIALVGFAGDAFVHCPLTLDHGALIMFLDFLRPGLVSEQGTDISRAIEESLKALETSDKGRSIVLVTDGEDHGRGLDEAIKKARERGVRIFVVGVGTEEGEPIPLKDAEGNVLDYKRDDKGDVVVSRLDLGTLRRLGRETGGDTFVLSLAGREISQIARAITSLEKGVLEERAFESYLEFFQVPLGLGLLLLVLECVIGDRVREDD
ncbi:MAG: VWA domain-containing protein [bacterium]|jgi:Ca-activated chloride channel family protein